jgi:endonuclease/exonuclease/phosphatase family metal-dependent hydrolase
MLKRNVIVSLADTKKFRILAILTVVLFSVVTYITVTPAKAANITDIISELWPKGDKSSGGLDYSAPTDTAISGSFNLTTYNVDGFPHSIGGNTTSDATSIAQKMEEMGLDIIVMQELFEKTKHTKFVNNITTDTYPYRSYHFRGTRTTFGDGLLRFSRFPFDDSSNGFDRVQWKNCAGDLTDYILNGYNPDCLTEKGFTFARIDITTEFSIDLYNLHNDAGRDDDSVEVKEESMEQLAEYINKNSADNVVIVAGDFNLSWVEGKSNSDWHQEIFENFLESTGVQMACVEITGSMEGCNNDFYKPDHILYRGNNEYNLYLADLTHLDEFVDEDGDDLSDHLPLHAEFVWEQAE